MAIPIFAIARSFPWDAINLEQKTISIRHKVAEDEVDGKFVPVCGNVLNPKSSFRTLPLLPSVERLLLAEKENRKCTADIYSHLNFHAQIESGLVMDGMFERNRMEEPTGLKSEQ